MPPTTVPSHPIAAEHHAPNGSRDSSWLIGVACGVSIGLISVLLCLQDLRWVVAALVACVGGFVGFILLRRLSSLFTLLVFTFQAEVALRPFYGRADTAGIQLFFSGLLAATILGILYAHGEPIRWRGALYRPIALMWITSVASAVVTSEHFAALDFLWVNAQLLLIYVVPLTLVRREEDLRRMLWLLTITLITQCLVYFVQSALGINFDLTGDVTTLTEELPRPGGTVSTNPAGFASYIIPFMLINIAYLLTGSAWRSRWTLPATILGMVALVLTFTRAAWAGFVLGFVYILFTGVRHGRIRPRTLALISGLAVVVTLMLAPMIQRRLDESVGDAYDERAGLMRIAMHIIEVHPFLGVGPGAYSHVFKEYLPSGMDQWLYTVHNEYLLRAAETGIVGGIAFVWLLIAALRQARWIMRRAPSREIRSFALGWGGGLIALAWQMYWVPWRGFGYNASFWFMLGLTEATALIVARHASPPADVNVES